jgi:DNA-binding PadR family transcriptional regulator
MSVRHSLLALLERGPMYGYGLKSEFEAATGQVWPLNVGQVYTTLARLERDGLVKAEVEADGQGQKVYWLTGAGRAELDAWFSGAVSREAVPRQELAIKLIFAVRSPSADVRQVIQTQRAATMRSLQELTRLKGDGGAGDDLAADLAWTLTLDGLLFQGEAEIRWLDLCEARLASAAPESTTAPTAVPVPGVDPTAQPEPGSATKPAGTSAGGRP